MPVLLDALANGSKSARLEVAGAIGSLRDAAVDAVPLLVDCMTSDDPGLRMNAIASLQTIPKMPDIAVPALIVCLSDPDERVRENAAGVLEKYGNVEAKTTIPLLAQAARQEGNSLTTRYIAAKILKTVAPQSVEAQGL